ncbi:hypothetical protein ACLIJS_07580 [Mammaliicoccus sciuri]|nr:hypothetical protein [Mammaliicoccus sciuri]
MSKTNSPISMLLYQTQLNHQSIMKTQKPKKITSRGSVGWGDVEWN